MTNDELERYIEQFLSHIRHRYIHTDEDDEACQRALIDLVSKAVRIPATKDSFFNAFLSFFYTWKRTLRARAILSPYRQLDIPARKSCNRDGEHEGYGAACTISPDALLILSDNPWESTRINALEFLNLIDNTRSKGICTKYYIEGLTLKEIAAQEGLTHQGIAWIIEQGVNEIKRRYSLLMSQ